jgi:hypothetical protein
MFASYCVCEILGIEGGGLFRLHNVIIVGFYYSLLLKLLHVSVVRLK